MMIFRKQRLSVVPVTEEEFKTVLELSGESREKGGTGRRTTRPHTRSDASRPKTGGARLVFPK
jgi:hypothetical protein